MATLVLLVSGVVIHRKIFTDFFTFRPDRKLPRSSLDLHNLTGVLALPFHFTMALSGLIIFIAIYFPTVVSSAYDGDRAVFMPLLVLKGHSTISPASIIFCRTKKPAFKYSSSLLISGFLFRSSASKFLDTSNFPISA